VWIGSKVSIRQGVSIGNGAVIGSNAVVLKDIEPYAVVAGIPAKKIKIRFTEKEIEKVTSKKYFFHKPPKAKNILDDIH
jgi:acetyltransferase-like isoleucine patch superfamily enzyme